MLLWGLASTVEEVFLINYFKKLTTYDNVTKLIICNNFCFIVNMFAFSVLAYLLIKMSGTVQTQSA